MNLIRLVLIITMFSASARAFPSLAARQSRPATTFSSLTWSSSLVTARGMSSTGEADTSIVDICKQKITDHLGTDKVTVTGTQNPMIGWRRSGSAVDKPAEQGLAFAGGKNLPWKL